MNFQFFNSGRKSHIRSNDCTQVVSPRGDPGDPDEIQPSTA